MLVLAVEVKTFDSTLVGRITVVVDEQFLTHIDEAQRTEEYFFGGVDKVVTHVRRVGMVIQAAITQHQSAVGLRPFEAVTVEDGVFKGRVVAMIDQNDGTPF